MVREKYDNIIVNKFGISTILKVCYSIKDLLNQAFNRDNRQELRNKRIVCLVC